MEETTYFTHSLIAYDILSTMSNNSSTYNITSHQGLNALKNLATQLALREVKSHRGTYEQSKLAGFCIATGWAQKNQSALTHSEDKEDTKTDSILKKIYEPVIADLVKLNTIILADQADQFLSVRAQKAQQTFFLNTTLPECIIKGFQHGMRLGTQVSKEIQKLQKENSTDNLIMTLLALVNKAHSVKRSTRHPGLWGRNSKLKKRSDRVNE